MYPSLQLLHDEGLVSSTESEGGRRSFELTDDGRAAVETLETRTPWETVADETGTVHPGHGYTQLRITSDHRLRAVDGLLTGLHEPEASHLDLLSAFVSPQVIQDAYEEAKRLGYLWHEFGDLSLII